MLPSRLNCGAFGLFRGLDPGEFVAQLNGMPLEHNGYSDKQQGNTSGRACQPRLAAAPLPGAFGGANAPSTNRLSGQKSLQVVPQFRG